MNTLSIHQHIERTSEDNAPLWRKLLAPLQQHFGLTYFCYQKVTHAGGWEIAGTNPQWLHYSAEKEFFRHDPSLIAPSKYKRGSILPETHPNESFQKTLLKDSQELFNYYYTLAIIEPTDDGCEYFFFSAPKEHTHAQNIYLQQHTNFLFFIRYFKANAKQLLSKMGDLAVDIQSLKGDAFFSDDNVLAIQEDDGLNREFLHDLNDALQLPQLTKREEDCLLALLQGMTAKEGAKLLGISPRTIEEHYAHLLRKFNCHSKRELMKKLLK